MTDYKIELEAYRGPLDLLLFLIRREEVDIYDIPIARVLEQYVAYVDLLRIIDADAVGDFLVMAATLMEIKSRMLLPAPPPEADEEEITDPRLELVRQLLQYKVFKDAARRLGTAAQLQALRHGRMPGQSPEEPEDVELDEVQIWDLLSVFRRLLEQTGQRTGWHEVVYDDTPLALHAADITDALERAGGSQVFEVIFEGRTRSQMIGLFLALLELIRQRRIRAEQGSSYMAIMLHLIDATPIDEPVEAQGFMHADAPEPDQPVEDLEALGSHEEVDDALLPDAEFLAKADRTLEDVEDRLRLNLSRPSSQENFNGESDRETA